MSARSTIAVVVQRYGEEVTGGSESLARAVAERLSAFHDVVVFTTCARDYVTWRDELPPGRERRGGVEIRRFPVASERHLESFNALSARLYAGARSHAEELEWLRRQGPEVPALVEALAAEGDRFAAIVFFTYLYFPTYWGLKAAPERSILVPTAHDEPPLRFGVFREVFAAPRAFVFCSAPEAALVDERFGIRGRPSVVAGIGIETPTVVDVERFRIRHDVSGPYALYAGRIDAGKGCAEMIAHYERYRRDHRGAAELLLVGNLAMPLPRVPGVRYLGYLDESEKLAAMAGARAVVCPSPFESLSIVLLESMGLGTPGLVSARSEVMLDHCRRSQAGLYYASAGEFAESLDLLVRAPELRGRLGENGRLYVRQHYRWDAVLSKYRSMIAAAAGGSAAAPPRAT